jgi:hypothetical protein
VLDEQFDPLPCARRTISAKPAGHVSITHMSHFVEYYTHYLGILKFSTNIAGYMSVARASRFAECVVSGLDKGDVSVNVGYHVPRSCTFKFAEFPHLTLDKVTCHVAAAVSLRLSSAFFCRVPHLGLDNWFAESLTDDARQSGICLKGSGRVPLGEIYTRQTRCRVGICFRRVFQALVLLQL